MEISTLCRAIKSTPPHEILWSNAFFCFGTIFLSIVINNDLTTMENYKELTNDLNKILARNYDAIEGYKNAADNIKNPALKAFFEDQVLERLKFSQEIEYEIQMYGQEVVASGSTKGAAHRTWMDLKTALSANNDEAVVEECIRGEEAACEDYKDLLNNGLPTHGSLYNILTSHKRQIERSIFHLKSIESIVS